MNTFFKSICKNIITTLFIYIYVYILIAYTYVYIYTLHVFFFVHATQILSNSTCKTNTGDEVKRFASTMPTPGAPLMSTMLTPLPQGTGQLGWAGLKVVEESECLDRGCAVNVGKAVFLCFLILWIRNDLFLGNC